MAHQFSPDERKAVRAVKIEIIPALTLNWWQPTRPHYTTPSANSFDLSEPPVIDNSESAELIDNISSSQNKIDIDHSLSVVSPKAELLLQAEGQQAMIEGENCIPSAATTLSSSTYVDGYHGPFKQITANLPPVDIVIEAYCSDSNLDAADFNHNLDLFNNNGIRPAQKCQHKLSKGTDSAPALQPIVEEQPPSLPAAPVNCTSNSTTASADSLLPNDLDKLKLIAARLNLQTRRSSYVTWRNKLSSTLSKTADETVAKERHPSIVNNRSDDEKLESLPTRISQSIAFIKSELLEMRREDEDLARQLISIRHDMQQLKLQCSQQAYDDMVDDAQWTLADHVQFDNVCDEPRSLHARSPLITLGITKMNLTERRYSVF